jgi:non-specific protein-tyrosine kinase
VAPPQPYGAPVRRDADATPHDRALAGLLEPAPAREPGEVDDHLVSLLDPTSPAAEQYRTVRLHIETLRRERNVRVVAITSPVRGDGRTMSAINVAGALAQAPDARVVLVEVDVRHPGVARDLGLPSGRGLSGYLMDPAVSVDAVLERPAGVGFATVIAGGASSMPYELLKSPRLGALFTALRERFDFVVVDTPPVFPAPDVGLVRPLVDGFVLIVRANRTPREMVRDSVTAIGPDRILGVLFNDHERTGVDGEIGWRSYLARSRGGLRAA